MRRIFVVMGALLLLVALAGAQATVIKYAVKLDDTNTPSIGDVVELDTDNELTLCGDADSAIGFVAMIEEDASGDKWGVVVNAGVISATVHSTVSAGDSLTIDDSNPGDLKAAGVGDRVVAVALEDISSGSSGNVLITGVGPIKGANQARIWQVPVDLDTIEVTARGDSAELLSTDLTLTNCGVDSVKIQFTGTVDDRVGSGGAVVKVAISDGSGNIIGDSTVVYLVDLAFYQSASVVVTAVADVDPDSSPTYNVMAWCTNGLTNGRIKGILTVVGKP